MLDAFFKNYFWVVRLVVLFVAAFFVARTVNAFVGNAIAPPAEALTKSRAAGPKTKASKANRVSTEEFLNRNLFNAGRENIEEAPDGPAESESNNDGPVDMDDCDASSLAANLIATFVAETDPEASVAVFAGTGKDAEAKGLRFGDKVLDQAEIIAIQWRNVYVKNNGRCEMFSLEEEPKKKRASPSKPVAKADTGKLGEGVEQTADGEYSIPRSEIDNVLSNLNKVATQARIVPSFHNGKANGFKLFSIRPNSLYSKIGIQNGDIVQRINGYEITSPDKALEIYSKLKDASSISVDLTRRGKSKSLSYNIR